MSVQEGYYNEGGGPLPEWELPECNSPSSVLSKWERFKRRVDLKWRPSLAHSLMVNIILLASVLTLIWVNVAFGGFFLNPSTMLGLFSLPILLAVYDFLDILEQEEKQEKKNNQN